ncbi:MAG: dihydropteroate synthase [Candidatus Gastranaerophilales bacterium]|nr:dihydropteroate synthase [Candidatus Gastranaerophilales bacterium]
MQFLSKTVLKKFINKEISSVGFDESYVNHAVKKHSFLSIKIFDVTPSQASIIKQTALSCDCDCAVNRGVIDCSVSFSNCILSGTIAQLSSVAKKLEQQPFSLSKLSSKIYEQIEFNQKDSPRTKVMGILNLTPNSFSDGGEFMEIDKAINHAVDMIESGATVIDIGAQSTKPKTDLVSVVYEIEKVTPIVTALKTAFPHIEISVDTMTLGCAKAALDAGADILNDVSFLKNSEFINICKESNKKLVIMHSRGDSYSMDDLTSYENVVDEVFEELYKKTEFATEMGLPKDNIIVDVGFGFAKTVEQNFALLKRIAEFKSLGYPILAGVSRKRFLQDVINTKEPRDADIQSALAASWLIQNEIEYVRVHDVDLTMQALKFNDRLYTF